MSASVGKRPIGQLLVVGPITEGRVLINPAHVGFIPKARDILRTRCATTGSASRKALVIGKRDMHDQLAFRGVPGNMSFTRRILCQNDTSRWKPTNVAIARLEFDLAWQPENKQTLRGIVPIHLTHSRRDVADVAPRSREVMRKAKRRIILEKLSRLESNFEIFHVSFSTRISKNSKTLHAVVVMPSIVDSSHQHLLTAQAILVAICRMVQLEQRVSTR
jgi:hypothetical protein